MVSLFWGNDNIELPASSSRIKSEMLEFIQEENVEFISYLQIAKETAEEKGQDVQAIISEFQKILDDIKNDSLMPLIRGHDDGEEAIKNFTTTKIRNERMSNQDNISFLEGLKVSDLNDSSVLNRLRGFGGLKFGQAFENLPDFDADEFLQAYSEDDYGITVDLTFKEVIPDDMDKYDSYESPIRFSYGNQNILFASPYTEEEIIEAKKEFLVDTTSQQPDFRPSKSKSYPPRITMDMDIKIPDKVVKELEANAKITVQPVKLITDKNNKSTGRFKDNGSAYEMQHKEFIELGVAGMKDRTNAMQDNRVYDLGTKGLVKIIKGNYEGAGRSVSVPESTEKEIAKKFFPMLKKVQEAVIEPMLNNPLKAYTYKGEVNFKTERTVNNSLTRKIALLEEGKQWKSGTDEQGNPATIQTVEVMVDGKFKRLSPQAAMKLESEAWTNKETGEKISNGNYVSMDKAERLNYKPNYYVITVDGSQRTPSNEVSTTHRTIREYRLKNAPEDAYAEKAKKTPVFRLILSDTDKKKNQQSDYVGSLPKVLKQGSQEHKDLQKKFVVAGTFGPVYTEEEKEKINKDLEAEKKPPKTFRRVGALYGKKTAILNYQGDYIDKGEYDKLQAMQGDEDEYVPARKVVISPKRLNELDILGRAVYEPVYDERELKEDNEADKKELEARRLKAKRAERKVSRKPADIADPSKFGRVTDKALAVVTGEGVQLNPLIYYANIKEAFQNVILHIELVITDVGEFTLSPMQRRKNDEMTNIIDDLRENLSVLNEKMGE